jgi:hypothetical protein
MGPLGVTAIVVVVLAATAFAVAHFTGQPTRRAAQASDDRAAHTPSASAAASASPTPTTSARSTPPHKHGLAVRKQAAAKSSPASAPPAPDSTTCTKPQFVTSAPTGGWTDGAYYLDNDMWNISGYSVTQTMYACSYGNWYAVADMNNNSGDGAVKTYPNAHMDFSASPKISSFHSITSTFAEKSPHVGIYEDAYDIWINGIASSGSTEVMVWNDNFHQVPGGSLQGSVTFGGRSYAVYRSGSYIAFEAKTNFTAGTVNLLEIFKWIMNKGWMPSSSTLGQIDYGAEIVSTNNAPATFSFTNFSVSTS